MATREEKRAAFAAKLAAMRAKFVAELPERLQPIRAAAERHDHAEVARLAHALRGTGGSYGIDELVALTLNLEDACEAGDAQAVAAGVAAIENACAEL